MALDKKKLEDGFEPIFNPNSSPQPEDEAGCAQFLTDVIIDYLGSVELNPLAAPGIGPLPPPAPPGPDPAFAASAPNKPTPVVPVDANADIIKSGFESAMGINNSGNVKTGWSAGDAAFVAYAAPSFSAWEEPGGYKLMGAVAPGAIALGTILSSESTDATDIASKLADHIHTFFTTCIFTGAYTKPPPPPVGPWVGPAPHVSPLI